MNTNDFVPFKTLEFKDIEYCKAIQLTRGSSKHKFSPTYSITNRYGQQLGETSVRGTVWLRLDDRLVETNGNFDMTQNEEIQQAVRFVYLNTQKQTTVSTKSDGNGHY